MSLESKILQLLSESPVLSEGEYGPGENKEGEPLTISPTDVKPQYHDLGAPIVSPTQPAAPDYTRGVPTQTPLPTSKPVSGDIIGNEDAGKGKVGYPGISGPQTGGTEWIVREEKDEEEDKDKDEKKEKKEDEKKDKKEDGEEDKDEKKDKEDVKEALTAIFAGEKLSENFKSKAATVFEAAVTYRVGQLVSEAKKKLVKENTSILEAEKLTLAKKVDQYLNYVIEGWMKENELAIEKGIKTQLTEDFLIGLKKLFAENYIEVPQEKLDVVAALANKVQVLEQKLNEQIDTNISLTNNLAENARAKTFTEVTKGLADTQIEKLRGLAEGLTFKDVDSFKTSLQTLKESYFPAVRSSSNIDTRVPLTEDVNNSDEQTQSTPEVKDADMAEIVKALDRMSTK